MKKWKGRYSLRSILHGISLLLVFGCLLLATLGLYLVSDTEFYKGNGNSCLSKNSMAFYGEDNVLYCPNTYFISSLNLTDLTFTISAMTTSNITENDMKIVSTTSLSSPPLQIFLDYQAEAYWYFNLNIESKLDISFSGISSESLSLIVDDDEVLSPIPTGSSSTQILTKENEQSRGYKVKIKSSQINDTEISVGLISFSIEQTSFGNQAAAPPESQITCSHGINCYWEFEFGEKVCISISSAAPRDWSSDSSGNCVIVTQTGFDRWWNLLFIGLACLGIVIILFINISVVYYVYRKAKNEFIIT